MKRNFSTWIDARRNSQSWQKGGESNCLLSTNGQFKIQVHAQILHKKSTMKPRQRVHQQVMDQVHRFEKEQARVTRPRREWSRVENEDKMGPFLTRAHAADTGYFHRSLTLTYAPDYAPFANMAFKALVPFLIETALRQKQDVKQRRLQFVPKSVNWLLFFIAFLSVNRHVLPCDWMTWWSDDLKLTSFKSSTAPLGKIVVFENRYDAPSSARSSTKHCRHLDIRLLSFQNKCRNRVSIWLLAKKSTFPHKFTILALVRQVAVESG